MIQRYKEHFNKMNDERLINAFNREVDKDGWTNSRASYICALHGEFRKRYDYSAIGDKAKFSLKNKVRLIDKVIKLLN